jgi:hypothetical protein
VILSAPGERIRDAEGRWTATEDDERVMAHVAAAPRVVSRQEDRGEQAGRGNVDDAIVLLPGGTPVDTSYVIHLRGVGRVPDGAYRVRAMSRTVKHVRVGLLKVDP